jgi:uncharacterized protein YndB with AHSA1/START domain
MPETTITAEPGVPLITITREFAAPPELVLRAHVDPDLLVQWLGPRELTMTVDRYEARDGGTYRYIHRDSQGNEYGFRGVFHGDPTTDGLVQTFEFEGAPGHVSLNYLTFTERDGRTELRTVASFTSVADRDAIIDADMSRGVRDGDERLEDLLAKLQAG